MTPRTEIRQECKEKREAEQTHNKNKNQIKIRET